MKTRKQLLTIFLFMSICIQMNAAEIWVDNGNDSGPGSLRNAIAAAAPGDIIRFVFWAAGIHVILTSGEIEINKDLNIYGNGFFHTSISGNNASRIFNITAGNVMIQYLTIKNGMTSGYESGGGIANSSAGIINIHHCVFLSCSVTGIADGGAIVLNAGNVNIATCVFDDNHSTFSGGAIRINGGTVYIEACTFTNNTAVYGGGGIRNTFGQVTLKKSTLFGNSSQDGGGFNGPMTLISCTIANNIAAYGGGGKNGLGTFISNCIVYNNTATVEGPDLHDPFVSNGYNIIGNISGTGGLVATDMVANPYLDGIDNFGGMTKTISLLCGSPAIDAADPTITEVDQRGIAVIGGRRDIGAFESNIPPFDGTWGGKAVTCFGASDGSAVVTVKGGGPGLIEYLWSNSETTSTISNLTPATYTITVTKANCSLTGSFTVTEPSPLVASCSGTNVTCAGASDGTAAVTVNGGPSTEIGLGPVVGAMPIQGTIYSGGVSGTCDCPVGYVAVGFEARSEYVINQFNLKCRQLLPDGTLGAALVNTCINGTSTAGDPQGPYLSPTDEALVHFNVRELPAILNPWDFPVGLHAASKSITKIYSGLYNTNDLSTVGGFNVPGYEFDAYYHEETAPDGNVITGMIIYQPEFFYGGAYAMQFRYSPVIDVPATVQYLWSNGATTSSINNLSPGTYTVTVTKGNCSTTTSYTVTEPAPLVATCSGTDVICNGGSSGTVSVNATGGPSTEPNSYNWNNGATTSGIGNLTAGTYTVTVTKGNCSTTCSYTINQPAAISADAGPNKIVYRGYPDSSCTTLQSTISGGTGTLTRQWSSAGNANLGNGSTLNVCPTASRTYYLTVTDAAGCTQTDSVKVCVFDVRCGSGNKKVQVCHGTGSLGNPFVSLCLSVAEAKLHLQNHPGEQLGTCGMNKSCTFTAPRLAGDNDASGSDMSLKAYPNPVLESLNISFYSETNGSYSLRLVSVTGQIVLSEMKQASEGENNFQLDLSGFAPGMYIIIMQSGDNLVQTRIIKE